MVLCLSLKMDVWLLSDWGFCIFFGLFIRRSCLNLLITLLDLCLFGSSVIVVMIMGGAVVMVDGLHGLCIGWVFGSLFVWVIMLSLIIGRIVVFGVSACLL